MWEGKEPQKSQKFTACIWYQRILLGTLTWKWQEIKFGKNEKKFKNQLGLVSKPLEDHHGFVNLNFMFCGNIRAMHIVELGLMAGQQAGWLVNKPNTAPFYSLLIKVFT